MGMNNIEIFQDYFGIEKPNVEKRDVYGTTIYYVPYNVSLLDNMYKWQYVPVKAKNYNYKGLINVIMGIKYDLNDTLAILFNYLDSPDNEDYKAEYDELQTWRKHAKAFSKSHFNVD